MRTIIAGSRDITDYRMVVAAVKNSGITPTVVLSGTAAGVDRLGEHWASKNGVPIEYYPADWDKWGKCADYRRNAEMADKAEALIALWDGHSRGTQHMINLAKHKGLKVHVEQPYGDFYSPTQRTEIDAQRSSRWHPN